MTSGAGCVFGPGREEVDGDDFECQRDELHAKIGNLTITLPEQVWCTDITYVPMPSGHAYQCALMERHLRKILCWAVLNTMETGFCLEALENALASTGRVPGIVNTGQCGQFTSAKWTGRLLDLGVKISTDGRRRWMDNVFIKRLWRSVKYEGIYLFEHTTVHALRAGLRQRFGRYNDWRPHEALGNLTPAVVYQTARRPP